jgi:hypothetical protein
MIKGMQIRDDCVTSIATALRTKDTKQVGAYYDNIITNMKRHLNTNFKKESSLENLHYTMVVYWERVMLPAAETKYNKVVKSKDSKGDTAKKPSQHQQQQYRSDAGNGNGGGGGGTTTNNTHGGGQSTGKKTKKKHKTAASTHAPGNGTSITPTQSICIEEEDQNQLAILLPPPATVTAGAVASSGPLPVHLLKLRLVAANSTYLALMKKHNYTGAVCMTLPAHTSIHDMLTHLETSWHRAMPRSSDGAAAAAATVPNTLGDDTAVGEKKCLLYLEAGSEASAALQGVKWGGPTCNIDLTVGDVVALLPAPRVDGELMTLYYSWDLDTIYNNSNALEKNGGGAAAEMAAGTAAGVVQQQQQNISTPTTQRGIAPAVPGEDAHTSLRRALKAAIDHAAKQEEIVAATQPTAAVAPLDTSAAQAATKAPTSIGQKRQRSELELELENALNNGLDGDGAIDAVGAEQQQQQAHNGGGGALDGNERPAKRARVPVGLRNLLTTTPAAAPTSTTGAGKTKAKKSPKKKAAARKKKGQSVAETSPAVQSAQQLQQMQQQQHMQAMLAQQQQQQQQQFHLQQMQQQPAAAALVGGMPLPAGMANYLQWMPGTTPQAQTAQVLQGQQQQKMGYMQQYPMQQQQHPHHPQPPQFYPAAHQMQPQQQQYQLQQQQTPLTMGQVPQASLQGFNGGALNSLFGDSMFRSLFDTPMSNHPQQEQPPQQQPQQQQQHEENAGVERATEINAGTFSTPGKEPRTTSGEADGNGVNGGDNTISKLPIDWACLSPPPNFKLPADFGTSLGGGTPSGRVGSGALGGGASLLGINGHSLLPTTSLLGFMDAHPKAQGAAATVMQKGVEALFQQVGGSAGGGDDEEALAAEAAAGGRALPTDNSLHSIESLLEKSNSNWLAPFATAQGAATNNNTGMGAAAATATAKNDKNKSGNGGGQQEDVPPACNRPFAALFGS